MEGSSVQTDMANGCDSNTACPESKLVILGHWLENSSRKHKCFSCRSKTVCICLIMHSLQQVGHPVTVLEDTAILLVTSKHHFARNVSGHNTAGRYLGSTLLPFLLLFLPNLKYMFFSISKIKMAFSPPASNEPQSIHSCDTNIDMCAPM